MQNIKFRAKRLNDPSHPWVEGWLVPFSKNNKTEMWIMPKVTASSVYGCPIDVDTIGQFTGMFDKNGREIWEGDIVRYRTTDERYKKNPRYCIEAIKYNESSARYQAGGIFYENLWSPKLEVIGNIYDNPELLDQATR